jgi:hypothetical protein
VCECSHVRHDLRLIEEEIEALEIAAREGDRQALEELVLLRALRERVEERLALLAA